MRVLNYKWMIEIIYLKQNHVPFIHSFIFFQLKHLNCAIVIKVFVLFFIYV